MASDAVLNVRLPKELKDQGNQVLERNGLSVSKAVRKLYEFMVREQDVPPFALDQDADGSVEQKRLLLRSLAGVVDLPEGFDGRQAYRDHLVEKHASHAGQVR